MEHTAQAFSHELRSWLRLADRVLTGVEKVAWQLRELAESSTQAATEGLRRGRDGSDRLQTQGRAFGTRLTRLRRTTTSLSRIALDYRLHSFSAAFTSRRHAARRLRRLHRRSARRFTRLSGEQGGAFLKVGQLLSARADILPAAWIAELSTLQDAAPALAFERLRPLVEDSLGAPLERLFHHVDPTPVAAASIGQVHRAVTHGGHEVAVKIQRPGVVAVVEDDLELLALFVDALRDGLPPADYGTIVTEVRSAVRAELDYAEERFVTARMAEAFEGVAGIVVPRPLDALSGSAVLTTEFIEGQKLSVALDGLSAKRAAGDVAAAAELDRLLGRLLEAYLRQVLHIGLFQADPHPGNFLVTDDGDLCLLDFGCHKTIDRERRRSYVQLLTAILGRDRDAAEALYERLGFRTESGAPDTLHAFADALLSELADAAKGQLRWPDRDALLARMRALGAALERDPVRKLPPEFVMIGRVFATLGGLFAHYRPDIDMVRHVFPVLSLALADSRAACAAAGPATSA
ncbi:MAG: AarF/ABC1/UbiB kinase family protein [Myxococcales bacterium]|nr:AarF/ABC1/UbiB kinase family protein [Myxococcales bacterium]